MKTKLKKKLTLLLVLALIVSLFMGLPVYAATEDDTSYLAFTSDVHFDMGKTNPLESWMTNIQSVVKNLDYMGFCGDLGSAYAATTTAIYWDHVQAVMDLANSYVTSGFITNKNIFIFGNHEWYTMGGGDYAKNKDNATAQNLTGQGEAVKTDDYIIYSFGAEGTTESYGAAQQFSSEAIANLKTYLEAAPTDIPIIIMSHFPIHTFTTRVTANAAETVNLLNKYPNVTFLWGHNHSSSDTYYDKIYTAGDTIEVDANMTKMEINFTYAAAGCMSDIEYGKGGATVKGKGMLIAVSDGKAAITYYDLDGKALVDTDAVTEPILHDVRLSSQTVNVNGVKTSFEAYNIDGSNYFKLRDIAYILNGTGSQFAVGYDEATKTISCTTGEAYVAAGGEMAIGNDKSSSAVRSSQNLTINGKAVSLTAFNIGGNNFIKLRDLGDALKFDVGYDETTRTVLITSAN